MQSLNIIYYFFLCSGYHGNLSSLVDISSKTFKRLPQGKKSYVHIIPLPSRRINEETAEESKCRPQGIVFSLNYV